MAKVKKNKTYPGVSDIVFMIQFKSEENCAEVFFPALSSRQTETRGLGQGPAGGTRSQQEADCFPSLSRLHFKLPLRPSALHSWVAVSG